MSRSNDRDRPRAFAHRTDQKSSHPRWDGFDISLTTPVPRPRLTPAAPSLRLTNQDEALRATFTRLDALARSALGESSRTSTPAPTPGEDLAVDNQIPAPLSIRRRVPTRRDGIIGCPPGFVLPTRKATPSPPAPWRLPPPKRTRLHHNGDSYDRMTPAPPPRKEFSVFNAMLNHDVLTFHFASILSTPDLISLYSISRDFNAVIARNLAHYCVMITSRHARDSAAVFRWKAYRTLCVKDPASRPHPDFERAVHGVARVVPSLRWLQFVLYREDVTNGIIRLLAIEGHRMPPQAGIALRKIWLTMDIATNAKRVGLMHNEKFWTDEDLWMATMVFIKLDMRLTDPVDGNGEVGLARLLWGQRSLTTMWRFLKGEIWTSRLEVLRAWVAHCWRPSPVNRDCSLLGLASEEVGAGELEGWGVGRKVGDEYGDKMLRVDQLVAQETVRRDMHLEREVMTMFLWGWVDPETGNNLPIPAKEEENPDEQWSDSTCSDDDDIDGMEDVEDNRDDVPEVDSDGENSGAPQIAFDYGLI